MKNKWTLAIAVCFGLIGPAAAYQNYQIKDYTQEQLQPKQGYKYDQTTGNSYRWNTDQGGQTKIQGSNFYTGSQWNTTVNRNGNMNGFDSQGNYWNYNKGSGMYYNYGTGETRYKGQRQ